MGVREWMNKRPWMSVGVTGAVAVAAGWLAYRSLADTGEVPQPTLGYWSTDDGATTFTESITLMSPLQHDGKVAVRAHLFSGDGGKTTFVGFLEKQSEAYVKKAASKDGTSPKASTDQAATVARLVKKPGAGDWAPQMSAKGAEAMAVRAPARAKGPIDEVYP